MIPLFEAVLDAAGVGQRTALLDVGCGSGLTLTMAKERGAIPHGLDISPGLLRIARDRLPEADLTQFQDPETGVVALRNTFRWVAAQRPSTP